MSASPNRRGNDAGYRHHNTQPSEEFVRNGDRVSLFSEQCCGFLASDGITSTSLVVERLEPEERYDRNPLNLSCYPNHFERCVFTLSRVDIWDTQGLGNTPGDPLLYGQVITLGHDYTDTKLCVNRRTQSVVAVGCNKVSLEAVVGDKGDKSHYFKILPRYKVRSEGDRVRCTDQILLKPELDERFLHVSEIEQLGGLQESYGGMSSGSQNDSVSDAKMHDCWKYEANISNTPTEWTIHVYDANTDADDDSIIRVGRPVALFHKEREGFAAAAHHTDAPSDTDAHDTIVYLNIPHRTNQRTYNIETLSLSVNCVWMVERANTTLGGPVMLVPGPPRRPTYRIKHLASHRYLAVIRAADGQVRTTLLSPDEFLRYEDNASSQRTKRNLPREDEKSTSPPPRHIGSDGGGEGLLDDAASLSDDGAHNTSNVNICITNPSLQGIGDDEEVASPQSAFSATSGQANVVYASMTNIVMHDTTSSGPTPPESAPLPPAAVPTAGAMRLSNGASGNSMTSTPNSKPRSPPHAALSSPGAAVPTADPAKVGSPSSNTPKEISFQIPSVSFIDRKRERERKKRPLDQMKGRARPPDVTLFYILPLDEGQTKLHSSTTFTKIQHVATKRWVQVYGQTSQQRNVKQPQKSNFQQALLKKHSLTSASLKKIHAVSHDGNESSSECNAQSVTAIHSDAEGNGSVASMVEATGEEAVSGDDKFYASGYGIDKARYKIVPTEKRAHDDVWCISSVPIAKLMGLNTVTECKAKLQQYIHHFGAEDSIEDMQQAQPTIVVRDTRTKLEQLIAFCSDSDVKDSLQRDGLPLPHNQELLFSLDIHKLVIRMIQLKASTTDLHIGKLSYWLLRAMIKGSTQNASHLFRYIHVFKSHISNPAFGVCDMLLELYRDNRRILEEVGEELVSEIVDYVKANGLHASCFELLGVLCTCDNEAVPRSQAVVLNALLQNPSLVMHTLVSHDNELWVKIPSEGIVRGRKRAGRRPPPRIPTSPLGHMEEMRSPSGLSSTAGSVDTRRDGSPVTTPTHPSAGIESEWGYSTWETLTMVCRKPNKLASFYTATLKLFVSICKGGFKNGLVEVKRWLPEDVLLALVGEGAQYWGGGVSNPTLMDIQAVAVHLALEAHIIPSIPSPPQGPSRLVVAWHNVAKTTESSLHKDHDYPFAQSLKRAAAGFLSHNTKQVYLNKAKNRLVSALLIFWQEVIRRNMFDSQELDELLPTITELMNGVTDIQHEESEVLLGSSLAATTGMRGKLPPLEKGECNEYSELVFHSKVLAVELFNSRLDHEAACTQRDLIRGFKECMNKADIKSLSTPPGTPKKRYGVPPEKQTGESVASFPREDSVSRKDFFADFVQQFRHYVQRAVDGRYLRQQNAQLLPVCLNLASYKCPELSHRVLTFVFKSLWFGAEIAANLQQAQILFSDESWVLFRELMHKKQTLTTMLQNISQNYGDSAQEEERCRALLGDLVSLLQPVKTQTQETPTTNGMSSRERMRRQSFRAPRRPRKGSSLGRKSATVTVNHSAVLAERQDIYRNLGFHELICERVLSLPLSTSRGKRSSLREIVQLGYLFLKLLCEEHMMNQDSVAVLIVDHLMRHIDKNVGACELAVLLYKKNRHLAVAVPPELIRVLVMQVVDRTGQAHNNAGMDAATVLRYLLVSEPEFPDTETTGFAKVVTYPVPRNQTLCMNFLLEKASGLKIHDNLHLYVKMQVLPPSVRGDRLSDAAAHDMVRDAKQAKRAHIVSHMGVMELCKILEILSLCCQGSNASTELGGQCVMPLPKLLSLVHETLCSLLHEPPCVGPLSPGIGSVPSPTLDKEGLYVPHVDVYSEKQPWLPPRPLVCVLLQFLHNVYLEEDQYTETSSMVGADRRQELEREHRDRSAYEWSMNRYWHSVLQCFTALVHQWSDSFLRNQAFNSSSRDATGVKSAFLSPGVLSSPDTPSARGLGLASHALEEERDETARKVIFKHIMPCVGTYLITKFSLTICTADMLKSVVSFVLNIVELCRDATLSKLSQRETESLLAFLEQVVTTFDMEVEFGDGIARVPREDIEAIIDKLRQRDEEEPSPRSQQLTQTRQLETAILDRFCCVQEFLLETFTEDVKSLNMLLLLMREEMENVTEEQCKRGREIPKWLLAIVSHLEDPELPEQVITGLLKVFTKLIRTAAIPLKSLRAAITGSVKWAQPRATSLSQLRRMRDFDLSDMESATSLSPLTGSPAGSPPGSPAPDYSEILEELDDDTVEMELTEEIIRMQNKLNNLGLTSCMVKLTERGEEYVNIAHEAICFGIALLHGGNKKVQDSMLSFFLNNDESFFESMKDSIRLASERLRQRSTEYHLFDEHSEPLSRSLGSIAQVLRLLQLVCEGHHLRLQNYIRLQDDNLRSTNVVREVPMFLRILMQYDGLLTRNSTALGVSINPCPLPRADKEYLLELAQQTFDTLTEFCQGPCAENQTEIVGCNICGLVDGLMKADGLELLELMSKAITTLLSVLEGTSGAGAGSRPPSVDIMLKTLKLETLGEVMKKIWKQLVNHSSQAGTVFNEMDKCRNDRRVGGGPGGAAGVSSAVVTTDRQASHYVYEDEWMENACEVLGVVEHVEKARENQDAGASLSDLLDVSFNVYILLLTLSSWDDDVAQLIDDLPGSRYFKTMVGTIEIARGMLLEKVYFRIPSTCSGLSRQTRHKVLWDLRDKESRVAKLGGFFEVSGELIAEMKYLHRIRSEVQRLNIMNEKPDETGRDRTRRHLVYRLGQFFTSPGSQEVLRMYNVRASLVANAILLCTYSAYEYVEQVPGGVDSGAIYARATAPADRLGHGMVFLLPWLFPKDEPLEGFWDELLGMIVLVVCVLHVVWSCADVYLWWMLRIRRLLKDIQARDRQRNNGEGVGFSWEVLESLWDSMQRETAAGLMWRITSVLMSLAAVFWSPFFSALHLLAVIPQSSHLRNVVSAVSLNGRTLLMTFAFGVLIVYLFSVTGYIFFYTDYVGEGGLQDPNCVTLLQCFTFTLMNGMRSGGGVGDIINKTPLGNSVHHTQRMVFDYLFFVGVIIILLSIVSGIITDSFTELRKRKDDFEEEKRNYCFVCGLDSSTFERYLKGGFKQHTAKEHNMWNYLYFHHHLLTKKEDEFTGQESYVWECIRELDFSFYPINKSMSLMELGVLEDDDGKDAEHAMQDEMSSMSRRLSECENAITQMATKIGHFTSAVESLDQVIQRQVQRGSYSPMFDLSRRSLSFTDQLQGGSPATTTRASMPKP